MLDSPSTGSSVEPAVGFSRHQRERWFSDTERHCRSTASLAPTLRTHSRFGGGVGHNESLSPTSTLTSSGDRKGLSDASIPLACADRHCGSATYLLHLPDLERFDAQVLSIGGAGVHDGIFFAGVVAALLT